MNPSQIRAALETMGRGANKRLGQHFLIDAAALRAVVEGAQVEQGDKVVEIGPGLGVLTGELLKRGANVVAIERDRGLAAFLRTTFAHECKTGQLTLLEADAADGAWLSQVSSGEWKCVSNLPYSITSLALRLALWAQNPPTRLSVLIQKEVAERLVDREKTSLVLLMAQLASRSVHIARRVPPGAFYPPPKVDSAVFCAESLSHEARKERWGIEPERVMLLAKKGFAHPRKMLFSNLGLSAEQKERLVQAGYSPTVRAEALSVEEWVAMAKALEASLG